MYMNPTLEEVIQAVDVFLNSQSYSDHTLFNYQKYGVDFFRNHFSTIEYSQQEA